MMHNTDTTPTKVHKDVKLGVIPDGWNLKTLDEIGSFTKGKGISKSEILESNDSGFSCVRYAEIYTKYRNYAYTFESRINEDSTNNSNEIKYGDILFAGSGETLEDIGKAIAYLGNEKAYAGGDIIIFRQENEDSKYLGILMNNDFVRSQLHKLGQGHSVVHIYGKSLKKVKISIPPLPEQQKIAKILASWDVAINTQEALITQKQEQKKGLMQQLLTGKKRLTGFEDKWEEVRLKNLSKITMGQSPNSDSYNDDKDGVLLIQGNTDIKNRKSKPRIWTNRPTKFCDIGDILMTVRAPVGAVAKSLHKACIGRGVCAIKPNENNDFVYFKLLFYEKSWLKYEQGSTFSAVSSSDIKNLKITIPKNIKEQKKIAELLTTADNEIIALQQQLQQLKNQKQGLMQQLLTGKIRVKV